jgi:hypothetical protein
MKRISMSAATAVLLAWSVTLGAQSSSTAAQKPSPSTPTQGAAAQSGSTKQQNETTRPQRRARQSASSSQTANQPQEMTLTGCLQSNDQSGASASNAAEGTAQGTSGTRRAQANATPTFTLANASQGSGGANAAPQSVGTAGSAGLPSAGSYILQGLDLSRQIGQQVEVTGAMMPPPSARRGRATGTSGSNAATESTPRIRVTSARMISEHCSNQ